MARWEPQARERLERAALELFAEQGFADTTVPQIAARAGLATSTFFRHFRDKREVLFGSQDGVPAEVERFLQHAPASLEPMALVISGLQDYARTHFQPHRAELRVRRAVIQGDDGLHERELRKTAALTDAITRGLRGRGLDELTAILTAHTAMTAFSVSIGRWLGAQEDRPLDDLLIDTLGSLRQVHTQLPADAAAFSKDISAAT